MAMKELTQQTYDSCAGDKVKFAGIADAQQLYDAIRNVDGWNPLKLSTTKLQKMDKEQKQKYLIEGSEYKLPENADNDIDGSFDNILTERVRSIIMNGSIRKIIDAAVEEEIKMRCANRVQEVIIRTDNDAPVSLKPGDAHFMAPVLAKYMAAGVNLYLTGPSGCGKTHLSMKTVPDMLHKNSCRLICSKGAMKEDIIGYMNADGTYVNAAVANHYKNGGVVVFDESDANDSGLNLTLNMLLDGFPITFPNGELIDRNPNCAFILIGNTDMTGATGDYNGREEQDRALRDRVVKLKIPYDPALEDKMLGCSTMRTAPTVDVTLGDTFRNVDHYRDFVVSARKALAYCNIPEFISIRAARAGLRLANQGIGKTFVLLTCLIPHLAKQQQERVCSHLCCPTFPEFMYT